MIVLAAAVTAMTASAASAAPPGGTGADLAGLISGPDRVTAGETFSYIGKVRNDGPRQAHDVVLTFTLNSQDLSLQAVDPDCAVVQTSPQRIEVQCSLGTLTSRTTATRTVAIAKGSAGEVIASARASASTPDPNADNNTALMFTQVNAAPPPEPEPGVGSCAVGTSVFGEAVRWSCTFYSTGEPVLAVELANYQPYWFEWWEGQIQPRNSGVAHSSLSLSRADNGQRIVGCNTTPPATPGPVSTWESTGVGCANAAADISVPEGTLMTCSVDYQYYKKTHDDGYPHTPPFGGSCRG